MALVFGEYDHSLSNYFDTLGFCEPLLNYLLLHLYIPLNNIHLFNKYVLKPTLCQALFYVLGM